MLNKTLSLRKQGWSWFVTELLLQCTRHQKKKKKVKSQDGSFKASFMVAAAATWRCRVSVYTHRLFFLKWTHLFSCLLSSRKKKKTDATLTLSATFVRCTIFAVGHAPRPLLSFPPATIKPDWQFFFFSLLHNKHIHNKYVWEQRLLFYLSHINCFFGRGWGGFIDTTK